MRVTKKLRSDLELLDSLQKISGYKKNKNSREKSPRTILLQKISPNENNIPIKVQLLKAKNNNNNISTNIFSTNSNSLSLNKRKIPFHKNDINNYYNKYNNKNEINIRKNNYSKDNITHLKNSFIINNKTKIISESPISNAN